MHKMSNTLNFHTLKVDQLQKLLNERTLIDWLKDHCPCIICLQETNSTANSNWTAEYSLLKLLLAYQSSKSKGVTILILEHLEHNIVEQLNDGRYIILKITMFKEAFVLLNVYFPIKYHQIEQVAMLEKKERILQGFTDDRIIQGGDFNIVLDSI